MFLFQKKIWVAVAIQNFENFNPGYLFLRWRKSKIKFFSLQTLHKIRSPSIFSLSLSLNLFIYSDLSKFEFLKKSNGSILFLLIFFSLWTLHKIRSLKDKVCRKSSIPVCKQCCLQWNASEKKKEEHDPIGEGDVKAIIEEKNECRAE